LADFGLVAVPHADDMTRLTSTAAGWATAAYCAPEQAINFKNVDKSVDIYAFGCILHDIVGNRPRVPFQAHTARGPIGAIISRCTAADPRQRFKTVGALRSALLDAIGRSATWSIGKDAAPVTEEATAATGGWRQALTHIHEWDADKLDELIVYIEEQDRALCALLDEERLVELHGIDPVAWNRIALAYCEFAQGRFDFGHCDAVATCLLEIFALGDVAVRAAAAMSAAVLASTHNRWFVLRKVLALCGPNLDTDVAERLAIDIRACEREETWRECAKRLSKPITVFHRAIQEAIDGRDAGRGGTWRSGERPRDGHLAQREGAHDERERRG
jgi:hypothetical protein